MGPFVAQRVVKLLIDADITVKGARVGVLGLTFKEDCNDIRNSKVPDILRELRQFGIEAMVHDPLANAPEAMHEYGDEARAHRGDEGPRRPGLRREPQVVPASSGSRSCCGMVRDGGVVVRREERARPGARGRGIRYWSV